MIIKDKEYENDDIFNHLFQKFPFKLSNFQKHAIEAIHEGKHALITAHTASGKTLPAEFAIEHFIKKGKKVIYTAPIKALSNQKFRDFQNKFPHIDFGILTGDIKFNPDRPLMTLTISLVVIPAISGVPVPGAKAGSRTSISIDK